MVTGSPIFFLLLLLECVHVNCLHDLCDMNIEVRDIMFEKKRKKGRGREGSEIRKE